MATCLLISLFVWHERTYDCFHENADRLRRAWLVAIVIAAPVAYLGVSRWLELFAYRIEPGLGVFVLAGVLAGLVAFLTVSFTPSSRLRRTLANTPAGRVTIPGGGQPGEGGALANNA